ncbi:hypothetical protein OTB20_08325 [Streptomyces sp. H27-H1]|uniref:hypothetical protein n=1 Tax=Streptomyces sp. H27-H1 TaxID=2996461 RepID=UPI00226D90B6|nr:hypothetical protein [Streptomyces sp. H27-H1]MCY0926210.1 hypothetical protein [Streptomyces sp. H27-H1]
MTRRTLARTNLLTFAAQPWNLYADDPNAGGGGAGATTVNEHGYPDNTPTADMTSEHQVAYWRHHARKHEARANAAPDSTELERLRAADSELKTRQAADLSDTERLQKERDDALALAASNAASAATATAELLRTRVATEKGLTATQAERLRGTTAEELAADADALIAAFPAAPQGTPPPSPRAGGPRGGDVGGSTRSTEAGAELYRQRHAKN